MDLGKIAIASRTYQIEGKGQVYGRLFAPEAQEDGVWACQVSFEGAYTHSARIFGNDSFQALSLAIRSYNDYLLDRIGANPGRVSDEYGDAAATLFSEWGLR